MTDIETQYIMENTERLEKKYGGRYIAVFNGEVVASGSSVKEVYEITDRKNIKKPLVTYVPGEGEENHLF